LFITAIALLTALAFLFTFALLYILSFLLYFFIASLCLDFAAVGFPRMLDNASCIDTAKAEYAT
jgi:hypothetical protein